MLTLFLFYSFDARWMHSEHYSGLYKYIWLHLTWLDTFQVITLDFRRNIGWTGVTPLALCHSYWHSQKIFETLKHFTSFISLLPFSECSSWQKPNPDSWSFLFSANSNYKYLWWTLNKNGNILESELWKWHIFSALINFKIISMSALFWFIHAAISHQLISEPEDGWTLSESTRG